MQIAHLIGASERDFNSKHGLIHNIQLEFVQIAPLGLINTLILQKRIFETPLEEVYKSLEVNNNWTANKQNVCVELITKTK